MLNVVMEFQVSVPVWVRRRLQTVCRGHNDLYQMKKVVESAKKVLITPTDFIKYTVSA